MSDSDNVKHDILLIIVVALVILFVTGISEAISPSEGEAPLIVPA